ncbi:hypothetical protein BGZ57DRAFT_87560 [Hyaloscypha finlandica]|nr:hypothetical protein BGZ57DRAFT_87560 [Hyaloscypha finlandica]
MSHFLSTLTFIPEWQTVFPQMVGEAGKEAVIMTRLQLSFPRLGIPTRISPNPEEGKRKGGGATSESGFRMAHGKKQLRHSELHSLQEIKNQGSSECEPSSASSLYNSQSKTWGSRTFEPQKRGNRVQHGSHSTRSNGSSDSGAFATPHAIPQGDTAPWDSPDWLASQKRV